jgi:tRNA1(Val) A37 N6-methylase TrmN6
LVNDLSENDLTHDAFLGGRIHLWQPRAGYRAGIDPVLLAACVPARSGQNVLELA